MEPEQGDSHSDSEVDSEVLSKISALVGDNGELPPHGEENDPEEDEQPKEPQQQKEPKAESDPKAEPPKEDKPELVEIEIAGKKYQVHAELKDGYLMQADYTRKTQEVAQQRTAIEQQRAEVQKLAVQAQQYVEHYADIKRIDNELNAIRSTTPTDQFHELQLRQRAMELSQLRQETVGKVQFAQQEMAQRDAQQVHQLREEGNKYLSTAIPDWDKPETKQALVQVGVSLGYKPEEIAATLNPKDVMALHTIRTLQDKVKEYESALETANKQIKAAPQKVVKPQASHGADSQRGPNEALQRLKKSGADEDAFEALKHMLGG